MLSLGAGARRVYLAVGATDLRKGLDGLYGLVRSRLEEDPMSGQLFVFCNAGRTRVKAFFSTAAVYGSVPRRTLHTAQIASFSRIL